MGSNPPSRVIATYPGTYRLTASFTANVTTPVGQYVTVSCVQFRSLSIIANVDVVNSMNGNWCNAQIQTIFANVQAADQLAFYYSADGSGKALQGSRCWWTMERIGY
jgi:hypothetical protein